MMEAIKTLNSYGLEVTSGIILGLDTDTADTESRLKEFIDLSEIPILTINLPAGAATNTIVGSSQARW